jgi:hypothetical protein
LWQILLETPRRVSLGHWGILKAPWRAFSFRIAADAVERAYTMTTVQTHDRALVLRCKRASVSGAKITVNYETPGGWNKVTGVVQSVRSLEAPRFRPLWEITIVAEPSHDSLSK